MVKAKFKVILRKILFAMLYSLILFGLGFVAAILISNGFDYNLVDVLSYEGLIFIIIGILVSMKGGPSGASINAMGQSDPNAMIYRNLEVARIERENTPYHKNFLRNSIVEFGIGRIALIVSGVFILISTLLI